MAAEAKRVNIVEFIKENFLYLPPEKSASSQFRLLKALQEGAYNQHEKNTGDKNVNRAFLNEERRRILKLPPLAVVDYNSMERAA